jgi:nucleoporin NDC1
VSAWIFGEVYIWSASAEAKLSLVDQGKAYERAKLNERPMYLRSMSIAFGLWQAMWHLYKDYDRVNFPESRAGLEAILPGQSLTSVINVVKARIHKIGPLLPLRVLATVLLSSFAYLLFLRQSVWSWTFMFAKTWHSLPKNSRLSALPPQLPSLFWKSLINGALLTLLWEVTNVAFDVYVAQPPMKKGSLLTDSSTDPNHSIIAGLKAKKEVTKSFAFWELLLIAHNMEGRRRAIFKDINRAGGSTWQQILTVCLAEVSAISNRVQAFQTAGQPSTPQQGQGQPPQQQGSQPQSQLPRISAPLKEGDIFTSPPPPRSRVAQAEHQLAITTKAAAQSLRQQPGQPATDPTKVLREPARKLLTQGADSLMSKERQQTLSHPIAPFNSAINSYLLQALKSPVGFPFQQKFSDRATAVICGAPHSVKTPLLSAISSLSQMAICSLKEDEYGTVSKDVPSIIRTFVSAEATIVNFLNSLQPHWTDVEFNHEMPGAREVPEVEQVLFELRDGLTRLINEFGEFAFDLGLNGSEIRQAKAAVMRGRKEEESAQPNGKSEEKKENRGGKPEEKKENRNGKQEEKKESRQDMAEKRGNNRRGEARQK